MYALGRPRPGAEKAQRRYYVKWRVDGRDRTRSFKTRVEADRFRSGLLTAVQDGERFDAATGEPTSWLEHSGAPTWWGWSQDWLALKWPQWSGHSRRSGVESLTLLTPLLVKDGAPKPPAGLADWLRTVGYRPGLASDGAHATWLERWSIALHEIEPPLIETVLAAVTSKADGGATAPAVARRRRGTFGAVLRAAVRRGLLSTNPMDRVEWRSPVGAVAIDVATVPAPSDILAIVDHVAALPSSGARYAALFATVGIVGMRPSEAIGLRAHDLELPARGWGLASVRGAVTSPGTRYTGDGVVTEAKGLKHRAADATRRGPVVARPGATPARPPRPVRAGGRPCVLECPWPTADVHELRPRLATRASPAVAEGPPARVSHRVRPPSRGRHDDAPRSASLRPRSPAVSATPSTCSCGSTPASSMTSGSAPTSSSTRRFECRRRSSTSRGDRAPRPRYESVPYRHSG